MLKTRRSMILAIMLLLVGLCLLTMPGWGMGPAVFLDSDRTVLSRSESPNGGRIGQVERIVVGGVPNIVVKVRPWWTPDWYLSGCVAASHYGDAGATIRWNSEHKLVVDTDEGSGSWLWESAPFFDEHCEDLDLTVGPPVVD